jgi:hypothetical protein
VDKFFFEDNPQRETVKSGSRRRKVVCDRQEDLCGPRKTIEEFDPGSA